MLVILSELKEGLDHRISHEVALFSVCPEKACQILFWRKIIKNVTCLFFVNIN